MLKSLKIAFRNLLLLLMLSGLASCKQDKEVVPPENEAKSKVLVFSKTDGYRHETAIAEGIKMFQDHAEEWKLDITASESTSWFSDDRLQEYRILVLLNTTGDLLTDNEQEALVSFIHNGGRVLAIHAAADAEYAWPWYNKMLGAWFLSHPAVQQANCIVRATDHPAASGMPANWTRTDEWYNFKDIQPYINVVYSIDESSYSGGTHGAEHPISWYFDFEGGKIFYTGMGHTDATYSEPLFIQHMEGALNWLRS